MKASNDDLARDLAAAEDIAERILAASPTYARVKAEIENGYGKPPTRKGRQWLESVWALTGNGVSEPCVGPH